jgi:arginine-tRNA-protein transferase
MTRGTPHDDAFRPEHAIALFASAPHACSYLPGRTAVTLFVDPEAGMDPGRYSALAELGFRRSGNHVYRPHCPQCRACVPARIPVADFRPNRSQRRARDYFSRQGIELSTRSLAPGFEAEHFALYRRYIAARHPGGGMDNPHPESYLDFLTSHWAQTEFVEFRAADRLLAVAVVDRLRDGLSSVYTFFDPDHPASLGRIVLLWQVAEARRRGLSWLYLGFWIDGCKKMQYKQEYRPIELLLEQRWQRFEAHQPLPVTGRG